MRHFFLFLMSIGMVLQAEDLFIVVDKNFEDENLTIEETKDIFLTKKSFINGKKILVMNYEFDHALRNCFQKSVLKKSSRSLERYWRKAYYKGKRPPKIIKSKEMLFSYMDEIQPSIGYVDSNASLPTYVKVLHIISCEVE